MVGGPRRGHQHLADSATAWGQDLVFLREWLADHPAAQDVAVAAFGYTNPQLLDVRFILPPVGPAERAPPAAELAALGPRPGWFAVDVNHLMASPQPVIDPSGRQVQLTNESANFSYFRHFRPVARAGYSILIYRIALEDANKIRRQLGLSAIRPPDVPPIEAGVLLRQAAM